MSNVIVSASNIYRSFGEVHAVRGVTFEIYRGQVVGFIGANGAGKTTTMRILATLDLPDAGSLSVCGLDAIEYAMTIRSRIGWMPDKYGPYSFMTVWEYLDFFGRAFGLQDAERSQRVRDVMEFADLHDLSNRYIDTLSKGMSQRLCLGRTLLHDPELLILDEPAAGLDPKARVEFKHLVRLLARDGKSLFISSHILSELEDMCDTLLFINEGKVVHHGGADALKVASGSSMLIDIRILGDVSTLEEWVITQPGLSISEAIRGGCRVAIENSSNEDMAALLRRMIDSGLKVIEFRRHQRKLEDAFVDILNQHSTRSVEEESQDDS